MSNPQTHPIEGRKKLPTSAWTEILPPEQQRYIGHDSNDIKKYFEDCELIHSLGCDSIINVPVTYDGVTLETVNLLHETIWYHESDAGIAMTIANISAPALLQIVGKQMLRELGLNDSDIP